MVTRNRKRNRSNFISSSRKNPKAFGRLEVMLKLVAEREAFVELLKSNLKPDWIVLILAILSKVCSSSFADKKVAVINIAARISFAHSLEDFVITLRYEKWINRLKNPQFWGNVDEFFDNLAVASKFLIGIISTKACTVLLRLLRIIDNNIPTVEEQHSVTVSDSTKSKIKTLIEKLNEAKNLEQNNKKSTTSPPNDFRALSVYPTCDEILGSEPAFIRENLIEGKYDSVEHYLDVQFRLLKEDFVAPLRQGIAECLDEKKEIRRSKKFSNVTICPDVIFRTAIFQKSAILDFRNDRTFNRIFPQSSKNIIDGSLVCFTKDNFSSVLFGRVMDRDFEAKEVVVEFQLGDNYECNVPYLMVVSNIFFEPYHRVLKALQGMSEINFPMKSYLVDVVPIVEAPDYLDEFSRFRIGPIKDVNAFGNNWPTAEQLRLNPTQYSTLKAALTQKFVVIQGPPGTGKTFMGLKIVKTLLRNKKVWYNQSPILVVALTNHALDQFLEGLISTTDRIVRVGGQSQSEKLEDYTLYKAREEFKDDHPRNPYKTSMAISLGQLKECSEVLAIVQDSTCVIKFKGFWDVDEKIKNSWFATASNSELVTWLLRDRNHENIKYKTETFEEPTDMEDHNNFEFVDEADYELRISSGSQLMILLSIPIIEDRIFEIQNALYYLNFKDIGHQGSDYNEKQTLESNLADLQDILKLFKMRMHDGVAQPPMTEPFNVNYASPHLMDPSDRWNLYFYWLNLYKQHIMEKLDKLKKEYTEVCKKYEEFQTLIDIKIMRRMLVVGMTTTGAARLQTTLQALKSPIVVVEEAAQVLESHVTISLTNHCQQLILLGDHQQLRPTTADYGMEKKFNLGISMFERMVINKIKRHVLGVQYRMRPEIAELIVPHIYPEIQNHSSVLDFPPIVGITSNVFFIHHEHRETENGESKSNLHEAKFLIFLACYLRQVGYKPEDITILSAYSGQILSMCKERKKYNNWLEGVRISVVDNYQGEESKIILLSLVRNNGEGKIGFLNCENRVCVALSRAKEGLYIMGNMDLLCQSSEIWPKIEKVLKRQNSLGTSLPLHCQFHHDQTINIKEPIDFQKVLNGGCNEICGSLMMCGHNCSEPCHSLDRDHSMIICTKSCLREPCFNGHVCPNLCYQDCGDCLVKIPRLLECSHEAVLPCNFNPKAFLCPVLVNATLPCGHNVSDKPCHVDVSDWKCYFFCQKRVVEPCGHSCEYNCHAGTDPENREN